MKIEKDRKELEKRAIKTKRLLRLRFQTSISSFQTRNNKVSATPQETPFSHISTFLFHHSLLLILDTQPYRLFYHNFTLPLTVMERNIDLRSRSLGKEIIEEDR